MKNRILTFGALAALVVGCNPQTDQQDTPKENGTEYAELLQKYTSFTLEADMSHLSDNQKQMVGLMIEAAEIMDGLFWYEAYGDKEAFLADLPNEDAKAFAKINYGPWDRLNGNEPWLKGTGPKPEGANFYPQDMDKAEFEAWDAADKGSLYTLVERNDAGELVVVWYHDKFAEEVQKASELLKQAAALAEDAGFKNYLNLRAKALLTDEYRASDMAWMDNKTNPLELVIGPIETYEDQLYGQKAAHEAYVLLKDLEWSERLARYVAYLPELQKGLPVPDAYKQDEIGTDADLNAYDVVYYAGDCNAGSKTIAINLPNDEVVQKEKGSRRLQLKNAMRAKFDKILMPLASELIAEDQRSHINFDAFFANTMFHEVAHGLGIKETLDGSGTVREALKEHASALEEGKADVLGLYMITQLHKKGELDGELMDYYVTFMASIFRSVRFGTSSAHGKANMIRFNYFQEMGAFTRDEATGTYRINFEKMQEAADSLSEKILTLQGDGDFEAVATLVTDYATIGETLQADLDRLTAKNIPVDIVFNQGKSVLGL